MLRTDQGVPTRHLSEVASERIEQLVAEGLAERSGESLRLVGRGALLVDSIVEHLIS